MSLQETMGGQGLELSPVTLQVLGIFLPLAVLACLALHGMYVLQALRYPERLHEGRLHLIWRPVHWRMLAWLLGLFLMANLLFSLGLGAYVKSRKLGDIETERLAVSVVGLGSYAVILVVIAWLLARDSLRWRDMFGCREVRLWHSIRGGAGFFLGSFPIVWMTSALAIYILFTLGIPLEKQSVFKFFQEPQPTWFYVCLGLVAVLGAPLVEELVFRGLLLPLLCKVVPVRFAILIVSAVFASIHMNLLAFFPLFVLAIYLSLAALYFRSIAAPIVLHMIFNAVNLGLFVSMNL